MSVYGNCERKNAMNIICARLHKRIVNENLVAQTCGLIIRRYSYWKFWLQVMSHGDCEKAREDRLWWNPQTIEVYYRCRLMSLHLLPLANVFFFIKSYKHPSSCFNISEYIKFSSSSTRLGTSDKMIHYRCSSNISQNFYFHRLPRLWN